MQSSEFLLNMNPRDIPTKDSRYYVDFWDNETHKAEYGLTVNGVFIPPFLYWHTQLWNIYIDSEDKINKTIKRVFDHPSWRDNEWMIAENYEKAKLNREGIMIFGSRRLGKSEFLASHIGRYATLHEGSENVVAGGNWPDIDIIMDKVTQGLNHLPDHFKFGRLKEDLRKMVELGFKDKTGTRIPWSKIIARNHEEGAKTEAMAGLTASSFVLDEVGKSKFSEVFEAAKPAFTSPYGWRCVPILTGTSGDIKKGGDAQKFFENPESNNFLVVELKEENNKKVSLFISGLRRMEGKEETTVAGYIQTEKGILVPEESELYNIPFLNSNFEKAAAVIDEERRLASLSPDSMALLKATMYYPKNTKELFLSDDGNNFPVEAMQQHISYLMENPHLQGQVVKLFRDTSNKVNYSYNTNKIAFNEYPIKPDSPLIKLAGPVMYEPPMDEKYTYLYISGADPYSHGESTNSNSIGSFYILKRTYDLISGTFQRRIVFSYNARPKNVEEFEQNCEMALELYNSVCMPESETTGFIRYFDLKNKGYMLADGYSFLKEISPNTSIKASRNKGLPATNAVKRRSKGLIYNYLTEKIIIDYDQDGNPIEKMGLVRIPDIGLLRELIAFNKDDNFDRYIGFAMTLLHEEWADKIYPFVEKSTQPKEHTFIEKAVVRRSMFGNGSSDPFNMRGNKFTNFFNK